MQFIEKGQIHPHYYKDIDSALVDFYNNKIDAIIVIPKEESGGNEIINLVIYLPKSDIRGTFVTLELKKPLEEYEGYVRDIRGERIGFEPIKLYVDNIPEKNLHLF